MVLGKLGHPSVWMIVGQEPIDRWVDGWMDRWIDGWTDGQTDSIPHQSLVLSVWVGASFNLDDSRPRAYCACSRCRWGVVWIFLHRLYPASIPGMGWWVV